MASLIKLPLALINFGRTITTTISEARRVFGNSILFFMHVLITIQPLHVNGMDNDDDGVVAERVSERFGDRRKSISGDSSSSCSSAVSHPQQTTAKLIAHHRQGW